MAELAIGLLGTGRMGKEILSVVAEHSGRYRLAGLWTHSGSNSLGKTIQELTGAAAGDMAASADLPAVLANADVAIDFTLAEATGTVVAAARAAGKPLVCGVSGVSPESMQAMREAARDIPVFFARNMSIGIALLERCVAMSGAVLGTDFQIEINDLHHAQKKDAPSGTALLLGEAAAAARGQDFADVMHYQPSGTAAPPQGSIVFHVRREGGHPGAHSVSFANASETLTFSHSVANRRVFASGALRAASWLCGQAPGLYGMQDLLADPGKG
ncbi:MAG: 4-hydroxy-tetrahydrodipicolinate reductase [Woeseia sp.]